MPGPSPIQVGDRVGIHPRWQAPGDDNFQRVVIEAPGDSPRVLIRTILPGFAHHPTEFNPLQPRRAISHQTNPEKAIS